MNVSVMSRAGALTYCHKPHEEKVVMISISDPYGAYSSKPFKSRKNGVVAILPLSFADCDRPGSPDVYGRETAESDIMSEEDAEKIAEFLSRHKDCDVIVHCDAGISRSAGVAAAILLWATGHDEQIFNSYRYRPNMLCYRKTLEALTKDPV